MSDLPKHVEIHEEGPREGFQIEPGPISTAGQDPRHRGAGRDRPDAYPGLLVRQPPDRAGLGRRRGCRRRLHAEGRGRVHGAVVQRRRAQPRAGFPQQIVDHRLDLAVRVGRVHAEEPAPQPCRQRRGDAQADRAASRKQRAGAADRRDGGVRLQLPGRHQARAGRQHLGGRARHRQGGRRRDRVFLAGRHDGLGDAAAHRARDRRGAQPLARHEDRAASA